MKYVFSKPAWCSQGDFLMFCSRRIVNSTTLCHATTPSRWLRAIFLAGAVSISNTTLAADTTCSVALPDHLLAQENFAEGVVALQPVTRDNGDTEIEAVYYRHDNDCQPETVDTYEINGGSPTIESSFIYSIEGKPNWFTIVSWPLVHQGLGTRARYYGVYAYQ